VNLNFCSAFHIAGYTGNVVQKYEEIMASNREETKKKMLLASLIYNFSHDMKVERKGTSGSVRVPLAKAPDGRLWFEGAADVSEDTQLGTSLMLAYDGEDYHVPGSYSKAKATSGTSESESTEVATGDHGQ
jgi:hypothetical protein